uniref:Uncharacterized protein n=1 Tax=Plectus sambesii TaxID=2011161 RepID=A0A914UVA9_9BILA
MDGRRRLLATCESMLDRESGGLADLSRSPSVIRPLIASTRMARRLDGVACRDQVAAAAAGMRNGPERTGRRRSSPPSRGTMTATFESGVKALSAIVEIKSLVANCRPVHPDWTTAARRG